MKVVINIYVDTIMKKANENKIVVLNIHSCNYNLNFKTGIHTQFKEVLLTS